MLFLLIATAHNVFIYKLGFASMTTIKYFIIYCHNIENEMYMVLFKQACYL